jgi:hypothetical protein
MSQEQVAELVNSGEFKKALKLAQKNNLDTDYIYKRQWESIERIFEDDVTDVLANVKDNTWVMDQCLMRTATDEKANETRILNINNKTTYIQLLILEFNATATVL